MNYDIRKISYDGLREYPEIRKSIKGVAKSLNSLTREKTYKANILSGIATNIAILRIHHQKLREEWLKERQQAETSNIQGSNQ